MNNFKKMMAVCLLVVASTSLAFGQQNTPTGKKRPNMEAFTQKQAERIAQTLAFDEKTTQKFVETFCNFRKEIASTHTRAPRKRMAQMTESETDQMIKARFKQSRKILDIREKYYAAYRKFLSPKPVQRVYDLERKDMHHFMKKGVRKGHRPVQRAKKD